MFNVLVKTSRALSVDEACIDAQTIPVPFDESHIDRDARRPTLDAAFIGVTRFALALDAA